jgi:hypothetical protein
MAPEPTLGVNMLNLLSTGNVPRRGAWHAFEGEAGTLVALSLDGSTSTAPDLEVPPANVN